MISTLPNKMLTVPENKNGKLMLTDGTLGGCGIGPIGDPNTYLPELWAAILGATEARTILDVGCGLGYSCRWFEDHGCEVTGLEGSRKIVEEAVSPSVHLHDFTCGRPVLADDFDLAWCSEFLEHVPAEYEPNIFAAFSHCRRVVISAALLGFGGHNHVNEQPSSYWVERFREHGFRCDEDESERLRAIAKVTNPGCYFQFNGLVFVRESVVEPKPLWTDIPGWLTKEQGDFLQRMTRSKRVLEIGSYKGRSAVCMAQVAKQVTSIDHHRGDSGDGPTTLSTFWINIERFGLGGKIEPIIGDLDDVRESITSRRFQVIYVDGAHDAESVERDTVIALECLLPGGVIIWHDYHEESVRRGIAETGIPMEKVTDLVAMGFLQTERNKVMVVMPHSRTVEISAVKACIRAANGDMADQLAFLDLAAGCLTWNFNKLLAHCLNMRDAGDCTHMAMLHSDIACDPGWVDLLSEEMCLTRAAAISAVVAIKDPDDDRTSTAIGIRGKPWEYSRYIRLRDQPTMPVTFMENDCCDTNEVLLINTGCMLIDLSYEFWDGFTFHVENRICKDEKGQRYAQFIPEDWRMSRDLDAANIPYAATWRVKTRHIGPRVWENEPHLLTPVASFPDGG